jgi:hypothetical protein
MKEIKEQPDNARRSSVMIFVIGVKDRVKESFDKSFFDWKLRRNIDI